MTNFTRTCRPITQDDVDSATRGLQLKRKGIQALLASLMHHAQVDMFASAVICAAIEDELGRRAYSHFGD